MFRFSLFGLALFLSTLPAVAQTVPQLPEFLRRPHPYVERLTGDAAQRHLDNLRARHPGLFERGASVLRAKGYRDTGKIEVVRRGL